MGRLKSMVGHLPLVKYLRDVRRGSEQQQERAEQLAKEAAPLVESLRVKIENNHFGDLVKQTFT